MYDEPRLLMCPPTHYEVEYVINPWMDGNIGRTRREAAQAQWEALYETLSERATVELIAAAPGLPDMCFTANAGLAIGDVFLPAHFRFEQREPEVPHHLRWFAQHDYRVVPASKGGIFEGEGDALLQPGEPLLWCGYGVRSSLETYRDIADTLHLECVPLRLIDERFYHLDTCFCPLPGGYLLYYPDAFDHASLERIRSRIPRENRFSVSAEDALHFACNSVWLGDAFITNHASTPLRSQLLQWGFETIARPLDQFILAGGSAKCLVLRLDHPFPEPVEQPAPDARISDRLVRIEGQLLDTGLLNHALDDISDDGGDFRVESIDAGLRRDQPSAADIRVIGTSRAHLDRLVERLVSLGAKTSEPLDNARTERVEQKGVAPEGFYSTTIYPTEVRIDDGWLLARDQRMDAVIRIEPGKAGNVARCVLIRDLKPGDRVVCGADGIRVAYPATFPKTGSFAFMSAGVSSERRVEGAIESVAWEMQRIRDRGGRTVVVAGPVVVHTGGAPYLAQMIRKGYVQALLGGNAIAVHDIERSLLGTSLGVDEHRSAVVPGGHRNHLTAINLVRRCGSIASAVEQGLVQGGIMYECVKHKVPFSLAGSIRDDGPLPDTEMDLVAAQKAYARLVAGADLVLMLASMLHSIGVGNMTPAGVRLVCVDISPAVVTKLADRGSVESTGIVTDTGLFLKLLASRLP